MKLNYTYPGSFFVYNYCSAMGLKNARIINLFTLALVHSLSYGSSWGQISIVKALILIVRNLEAFICPLQQ